MKKGLWLLIVVLGIGFSGCAKKKEVPVGPLPSAPVTELKPSAEEVAPPAEEAPKAEAEGVPEVEKVPAIEEETLAAAAREAEKLPLEERWELFGRSTPPLKSVFFDFDDYRIRPDMISRLKENARFLLEHPEYHLELQGNCDERGDREYNLALGEKRALEVKRFLVNMGVDPERLTTVSFGEERPLAPGHDERSWALNRRVDLVIVNP